MRGQTNEMGKISGIIEPLTLQELPALVWLVGYIAADHRAVDWNKKAKRNMKTSAIDPLDISSAIFGKRVNLSKVYFPAYKFISDSEPDDKDEDNFVSQLAYLTDSSHCWINAIKKKTLVGGERVTNP